MEKALQARMSYCRNEGAKISYRISERSNIVASDKLLIINIL
jgi:hypothetical protein